MSEFYHDNELERERSEDYYAGYYWGNNPYDSNELAGRINDQELKSSILKQLEKNGMMSSDIMLHVKDGIVILIGHINTYEQRRSIGQEVWNISGVVKVLNDLQVTDPETAGPSKVR
jgi:osmotically-inducible protein OsmY